MNINYKRLLFSIYILMALLFLNDCATYQRYSNRLLNQLIHNDLIKRDFDFTLAKRNNDESNEIDKTNENKYSQSYGDGIHITMNGEKVDICDEEYVQIVEKLHPKLKNVLISACTGSSSAKWVIQKVAKYIFKKDL